jgi:hypothetical protein
MSTLRTRTHQDTISWQSRWLFPASTQPNSIALLLCFKVLHNINITNSTQQKVIPATMTHSFSCSFAPYLPPTSHWRTNIISASLCEPLILSTSRISAASFPSPSAAPLSRRLSYPEHPLRRNIKEQLQEPKLTSSASWCFVSSEIQSQHLLFDW